MLMPQSKKIPVAERIRQVLIPDENDSFRCTEHPRQPNKLVSKFPVVKVFEDISKHKYGDMVIEKFNGTRKGIEIYASCMKGIIKDDTVRNPKYIESIIEKRIQGITCCWGTCNIDVVEVEEDENPSRYCIEHLPMYLDQIVQVGERASLSISTFIFSIFIPIILNMSSAAVLFGLIIR